MGYAVYLSVWPRQIQTLHMKNAKTLGTDHIHTMIWKLLMELEQEKSLRTLPKLFNLIIHEIGTIPNFGSNSTLSPNTKIQHTQYKCVHITLLVQFCCTPAGNFLKISIENYELIEYKMLKPATIKKAKSQTTSNIICCSG